MTENENRNNKYFSFTWLDGLWAKLTGSKQEETAKKKRQLSQNFLCPFLWEKKTRSRKGSWGCLIKVRVSGLVGFSLLWAEMWFGAGWKLLRLCARGLAGWIRRELWSSHIHTTLHKDWKRRGEERWRGKTGVRKRRVQINKEMEAFRAWGWREWCWRFRSTRKLELNYQRLQQT